MDQTTSLCIDAFRFPGQDFERHQPADLPVEQPTKFEFIVNLKAAKQIGMTIPPNGWRERIRLSSETRGGVTSVEWKEQRKI